MVQVLRPFEEEDVAEPEKEERCAQPIEETDGDQCAEQTKDVEVEEHSVARPGAYPVKERVSEVVGGIDPVPVNSAAVEIAEDLPKHHCAEGDTEEDQARNIDLAEQHPGDAVYDFHPSAIVNTIQGDGDGRSPGQ